MPEAEARDMLLAAYMAEVEHRGRTFVCDEPTLANIAHLARFMTSDGPKFGVMFCGLCGNGKTTLLHALQTVINIEADRKGGGRDIPRLLAVDAKQVVARAKDSNSFRELKDSSMMAIEDMGRDAAEVLEYGNVLNPVIDLIEHRYNCQLFTAITTNLTGEQVRVKYGNRIADRFNEMIEVIVFKNESYRR